MGLNQTYELLQSKGNYLKKKKDNLWNGRKSLQMMRQGLNLQNIQTTHTTQQQNKPNNLIEK